MSDMTPELRDEIAQHLRESSGIPLGMVFQDMERGLTVEQIASSQGIPLDSARDYVRGVEELLSGKLPTTPSAALNWARIYRYLQGCNLSPALRSYAISCLHQLAAINPEVSVEKPFRPGTLRDAGTQPGRGRKVWVFQANPQLFDLLDFLTQPSTQTGAVDSRLLWKHAIGLSPRTLSPSSRRPRIVLRRNTFGSMKPVVAQWDSRSPRGRFGAPPGRLYALTFKHFEDLLIGDAPTFAQVADLGYGCV